MTRLLFIPFSVIGGLIAGFVGKRLFDQAWGLIDEQEPPESEHQDTTWSKLLTAAALQGAIFAAVKAATDHGSRRAFANVTGTWPGSKEPEPE